MLATNRERYNADWPTQNPIIKGKIVATNRLKYNVDYYAQTPEFWVKYHNTCMKHFGCIHPMHNPEVAAYCFSKMLNKKTYAFPNGVEVLVQGYEPFALDKLVSIGYTSDDIIVGMGNVPIIDYEFGGKPHKYYPDIFIPKEKLIIEVKSQHIYDKEPEKNETKMITTRRAGYNTQLVIFDEKGNVIHFMNYE